MEMFSVRPKLDCPHVDSLVLDELLVDVSERCSVCKAEENWLCLSCGKVLCSRYANKHMLEHYEKNQTHCVVLSFSDGSFFCYQCVSEESGELGDNVFVVVVLLLIP